MNRMNNQTLMFCYPVKNTENFENFENSGLSNAVSGWLTVNNAPINITNPDREQGIIWNTNNGFSGPQGQGNQIFLKYTQGQNLPVIKNYQVTDQTFGVAGSNAKTVFPSSYYLIQVDASGKSVVSSKIQEFAVGNSPYANITSFRVTTDPAGPLFNGMGANYYIGYPAPAPTTAPPPSTLKVVTSPEISYDNYNCGIYLQNPTQFNNVSVYVGKVLTGNGIPTGTKITAAQLVDSKNSRTFKNCIYLTLSMPLNTDSLKGTVVDGTVSIVF